MLSGSAFGHLCQVLSPLRAITCPLAASSASDDQQDVEIIKPGKIRSLSPEELSFCRLWSSFVIVFWDCLH